MKINPPLCLLISLMVLTANPSYSQGDNSLTTPVYLVPNFHPASCGWLTDFSTERIYCANSYFAHMDRVKKDPNYNFVISEVNNMIAMLNFRPDRFEELKKGIKEGRIEAVNGFFLELSPNLSGGEAIVRMGINGIKWQEEMLGVRPRFSWLIDVTGMNEQMAQIGKKLGFDAQVYCRNNISGNLLHWAQSPDGSRLLSISGGHYGGHWGEMGSTEVPLSDSAIIKTAGLIRKGIIEHNHRRIPISVPAWSPYLILHGARDYSLPPKYENYPTELISQWKRLYPKSEMKFTTLGSYYDRIKDEAMSVDADIPIVKGGWAYDYTAFWVEGPKVKQQYRQNEHLLMSAEMLSSFMSLTKDNSYASQDLYHAWLQLHLNTDRNTIWGAASGMVFTDEKSWNANDRFHWISSKANEINSGILKGEGKKYLNMFNPTNWERKDPQIIKLPRGRSLDSFKTQEVTNGVLFQPKLSSVSISSAKITKEKPGKSEIIPLPELIKNKFYEITINPKTGEIQKLALAGTNKTIIDSTSNYLIAEQGANYENLYSHIPVRASRIETATTKGKKAKIHVEKGDVATIIEVITSLYKENDTRKIITLYHDFPRIDFDISIDSIADRTLVSEEFVPSANVYKIRRGIPYGFASGTWPLPDYNDFSYMEGVIPAVRWSDYQIDVYTGFAILDRGVTGREHEGNNPRILLTATSEIYYGHKSEYLGGTGENHFEYAIVAYDTKEDMESIPRMAWEYNAPAIFEESNTSISSPSFFSSSDNIILHSMRRENNELELRFAESMGKKAEVSFIIKIPNKSLRLTDFLGDGDQLINKKDKFVLSLKPQEIITIRFKTDQKVEAVKTLTDWTPLVPEHKRAKLHEYDGTVVGHPPRGVYE